MQKKKYKKNARGIKKCMKREIKKWNAGVQAEIWGVQELKDWDWASKRLKCAAGLEKNKMNWSSSSLFWFDDCGCLVLRCDGLYGSGSWFMRLCVGLRLDLGYWCCDSALLWIFCHLSFAIDCRFLVLKIGSLCVCWKNCCGFGFGCFCVCVCVWVWIGCVAMGQIRTSVVLICSWIGLLYLYVCFVCAGCENWLFCVFLVVMNSLALCAFLAGNCFCVCEFCVFLCIFRLSPFRRLQVVGFIVPGLRHGVC